MIGEAIRQSIIFASRPRPIATMRALHSASTAASRVPGQACAATCTGMKASTFMEAGNSPSIVSNQASAGNFSARFSSSDRAGGGMSDRGRRAAMTQVPWLVLAFVVAAGTTYGLARVAERFGRCMGVLDVPRAGDEFRAAAQ